MGISDFPSSLVREDPADRAFRVACMLHIRKKAGTLPLALPGESRKHEGSFRLITKPDITVSQGDGQVNAYATATTPSVWPRNPV